MKQRIDEFDKAMQEQTEGKSHSIESSMIMGYLSIHTGYMIAMESTDFPMIEKLAQNEHEKLAIVKVKQFLEGKIKDIPPIPKTAKELLMYPMAGME